MRATRLFTLRPAHLFPLPAVGRLCLGRARVLTFPLKFTVIFSPYSFAEEEH
jgi:hypothetical protein